MQKRSVLDDAETCMQGSKASQRECSSWIVQLKPLPAPSSAGLQQCFSMICSNQHTLNCSCG